MGPFGNPGVDGIPGIQDPVESSSRTFLLDNAHMATEGITIVGSTDDDENVGFENKLRGGLVLVRIEAGGDAGKYCELNHASAPLDGDITRACILMNDVNMLKGDGSTSRADKHQNGLIHGFVDDAKLFWGTGVLAARKDAVREVLKLVDFKV